MALFWQQFRAELRPLLVWIGATLLVMMIYIKAAPSFVEESNLIEFMATLPEALQAMIGSLEGLSPVDAYVSLDLGKTTVLILPIYAVLLALGAVTREVDRRTVDFLLSLPVERRQVILSRVGIMFVNVGLVAAAAWLAVRIGFATNGIEGSWGGYALMLFSQWLLAMALGSLTLLTSLWVNDYSLAVKLYLGLVAAAYFLEFALRAVGISRWGRALSPFSYSDTVDVLKNGLPVADTLILTAVIVGCVALSIPVFERKQISV